MLSSSSPYGSVIRVANDLQLLGDSCRIEAKLKLNRFARVLRHVDAYIGVNPVDALVSMGSVMSTSSSSTRCFVFSNNFESSIFREGSTSDYLVIEGRDLSSMLFLC